LILYSKKANDP